MSTIFVGPEKTPYKVHRDLICSQSPFFTAALRGSFLESSTQSLELPDIDTKCFDHVILYLYQNRLEPLSYFFKDGKATYFTLLDLYATADQLDIEGLRNGVVDLVAELAEVTNSVPTPTDTWILYDSIRENSGLRELVLDLFAFKKTDNLIATHPDEWHPSFLRDLVCRLKRPGPKALSRHKLERWEPSGWTSGSGNGNGGSGVKACEVCKGVILPGMTGWCCEGCRKGFCKGCVESGKGGGAGIDWSLVEKECKPWLRGMCGYHEHVETEVCSS